MVREWLININSYYVPRRLNCHINLIFRFPSAQDCPDSDVDFRAQQCSEFNNQSFRGQTYKWEPYIKGNEQELRLDLLIKLARNF